MTISRISASLAAALSVGYVSLFLYGVAILQPSSATAGNTAPSGSYGTYTVVNSDDWFYTWDFDTTSISYSNVDWPIRFLFTEEASINYVKNRIDGVGGDPSISPQLGSGGSTNYAYIQDNDSWFDPPIDGDGGKKQGIDSCDESEWDWGHMRFYANNFWDYNYNSSWSYWIIGSAHKDYEGGGCASQYLSTESTEDDWLGRLDVIAGSHGWSWSDYYNYLGNGGQSCSYYLNITTGGGTPYHWYCGDGYPVRVWVD